MVLGVVRCLFFGGPWADRVEVREDTPRWIPVRVPRVVGEGWVAGPREPVLSYSTFVYELRRVVAGREFELDSVCVPRTGFYYPARSGWLRSFT